MIFILLKRLAIIFPLLGANFLQCPFGDPITTIDIYNNRSESISVRYRFLKRDFIPELKLEISAKKTNSFNTSGIVDSLSSRFRYLIIIDSNGAEIMNLRGSALDEQVKLISKNEDYIDYRLDVN